MEASSTKKKRGPEPRLSQTELLAAGARAVMARASEAMSLSDTLAGIKIREVIAEASAAYAAEHGEAPDPPFTASLIYRRWEDKDDFLQDVLLHTYTAQTLDFPPTMAVDGADWESSIRLWVAADQDQVRDAGPQYFLVAVAAAHNSVARKALTGVYDTYDDLVVPALRAFLETYGLEVALAPTQADPDGCRRLAAMLTAVTEGWYVRSLAQPHEWVDATWIEHALATVRGATRPLRDPS